MPSCVVKNCKNYSKKYKKSQGITFHRFPKNEIQRDEWTLIVQKCRGESNWNPTAASTVCSAHFDELDFMTTAKGRRCLVPYAVPQKLLSNSPEIQAQCDLSPILQMSSNARDIVKVQQPTSSSSTISTLPQVLPKNEFKLTGYCRLCATLICDGTLVDVEKDNAMKELVVKMSIRLNTNIDFSHEHLPTTLCSVCIKSLYTSYDFVVGIDLAQRTLNKILMEKHNCQIPVKEEDTDVDMSNIPLKQENNGSECDLGHPCLDVSTDDGGINSSQQLSPNIENSPRPHLVESNSNTSLLLDSRRTLQLKYTLQKKRLLIDSQKKNIKRLNQKVRRITKRNESLMNIVKNLKEKNVISPDLLQHIE